MLGSVCGHICSDGELIIFGSSPIELWSPLLVGWVFHYICLGSILSVLQNVLRLVLQTAFPALEESPFLCVLVSHWSCLGPSTL